MATHSAMNWAVPMVFLLVALPFCLLILAALAMLFFDKTRKTGAVLLLVPVVLGVLGLVMFVGFAAVRTARQRQVARVEPPTRPPMGAVRVEREPVVRLQPTSTPPPAGPELPGAAQHGGKGRPAMTRPTMTRALADSIKSAIQSLPPMRAERLKQEEAKLVEADRQALQEAARRAGQAKQTGAAKTPPKDTSPKAPGATVEAEDPADSSAGPSPATPPPWLDAITSEPDSPAGFPARVLEGTYQMVVKAGPYETREECESSLPDALERGVRQFIARDLGEEPADRIHLPLEFIATRVVKDQVTEPVNTSFGPMVQVHALLRFDREVQARIHDQWNRILVNRRLWHAGGALGGVLLLLSVVYGYLKTDLATQGAYRWRLRLLSGVLILALAGAGLALVR